MLRKLFSRPKVKVQPGEPHPLPLNFANHIIPTFLQRNKAGFLNLMISPEANDFLHTQWKEIGSKVMGAKNLISSEGLSVSPFRKENHFFLLFRFPQPHTDGEPYYSLVVFEPPCEGEWCETAAENAKIHYYASYLKGEFNQISQLADQQMNLIEEQIENKEPLFVEWVMNKILPNR